MVCNYEIYCARLILESRIQLRKSILENKTDEAKRLAFVVESARTSLKYEQMLKKIEQELSLELSL